jgi:hypothetical protein
MPSLNLRGIPEEVIRKIKARAALAGVGVRDYAVGVLEADAIGGENCEAHISAGRQAIVGAASAKTREESSTRFPNLPVMGAKK